jgi:tetratricopeptide (TPR) repeat protein
MGDLTNALDEFQKAESDANRTGLVADADFWLINAASVSYDSGNFAQAEADGQRALKLAKDLNDRSATIGCMQLLALVSMAHDHLPAADQFLREAGFGK